MLNLLYCILTFNLLIVFFKLFEKYRVDNLQALIFNYLTAAALGVYYSEKEIVPSEIIASDWLIHALITGTLFISVFNCYALGAQKVGLSISTVANKMSLIIPILVAIFLYDDEFLTSSKIIGIFLAFAAIYYTSSTKGGLNFDKKYLWLVLLIFVGQGISDSIFNDAKHFYVSNDEDMLFFITLFGAASLVGILFFIIKSLFYGAKTNAKSWLWGIAFGIPNFICLKFFFQALGDPTLESSTVFPLVSMGIIISSAIIGSLFFTEKLSLKNWIGILLAVLSISAFTFGPKFL